MCHTLQTLRILFNTPAQWTGIQSLTAVGCGSRRPLSNVNMVPCYLADPECQASRKPILTCSTATSLTFNILTLYSICKQDLCIVKPKQPNVMQHVNNVNVYFALGNNLYIRKFHPWFSMFTNLAFRKGIRQCLFEFPLMPTHSDMFKALKTSMG